jgi:hypothetical protein
MVSRLAKQAAFSVAAISLLVAGLAPAVSSVHAAPLGGTRGNGGAAVRVAYWGTAATMVRLVGNPLV